MTDPQPGAPPRLEHPDPITGTTRATITKTLHGRARDVGSAPLRIVVDADVVAPGPQTASALALLGIDEPTVDAAWSGFVRHVNDASFVGGGYEYALDHQEGMGWQIEVDIGADGITEVDQLAYTDPRTAHRDVTFRALAWSPEATSFLPWDTDDAPRTSQVRTRSEPIDPGGAVGAFYSGISDEQIDSTRHTKDAVAAALADLEAALDEIEVAIRVAELAWAGVRADATQFKMGLEGEVVLAITDTTRGWDDYLAELVEQQRLAKEHDDRLQRELATELAITILAGVVTFGFGAAVSAGVFTARLTRWAHDVAAVRALLSSRFAVRAGELSRTAAGGHATRILARAAGDLSVRAVVHGATERDLTGQDVLLSFVLAGGVGHVTSEAAGAALKRIETRYGIRLSAPAFGAAKGAVQGGPRAAAAAPVTPTEVALATGFIAGIPTEAVKHTTSTVLRRRLTELLRADPAARAQALARVEASGRHRPDTVGRSLDELVDDDLAAEAGRRIAPVLDYLVGVGGAGAVATTRTVIQPAPDVSLPEVGGRAPQRVGGPP